MPDYVLEEHPELATWEGFKDPEVAKAFATAETGDKGRFLGTDPSYSQADEAIITNLELPYQVVYSGSEAATIAELDSKVAADEPIVMYWWAPTAAAGKYNLQKVELPEYTDECYADPAAIACDYPEDVLVKLASSGLEAKDPAVFAFLQNFQISTEDQLAMLPSAEIDGVPAADVAAEWIAANEAIWRPGSNPDFPGLCHRDRRRSPVAVTQTGRFRGRGAVGMVGTVGRGGGGPSTTTVTGM